MELQDLLCNPQYECRDCDEMRDGFPSVPWTIKAREVVPAVQVDVFRLVDRHEAEINICVDRNDHLEWIRLKADHLEPMRCNGLPVPVDDHRRFKLAEHLITDREQVGDHSHRLGAHIGPLRSQRGNLSLRLAQTRRKGNGDDFSRVECRIRRRQDSADFCNAWEGR